MAEKFDFVSTSERPALLGLSTPEWADLAGTVLTELGFKPQVAATHGDFLLRFSRTNYEVVILEELFCASSLAENATLRDLQQLPMSRRRHATVILIGEAFQTFNPLQAFQQSVHAVINPSEVFLLKQLVEKALAENKEFLANLHQTQARLLAGKTRDRQD